LGHSEKTLPTKKGFDPGYVLNASGADNYKQRPYFPGQGKPPWFKDGEPSVFYSSLSLVDEIIGFMNESKADKLGAEAPFCIFNFSSCAYSGASSKRVH
jgi:hypothetical protein